ncbi:MAG: YbeD family protein [Gammaproteobacteria bacterium]
MSDNDQDTLLEFPCDFPIKVIGRAAPDFDTVVFALVRSHAPELGEGAVKSRASGRGNYQAATVTVRASSKAQLDAIYRELTACERILMVL